MNERSDQTSSNSSKMKKDGVIFEFCEVCNLNHNQDSRHKYFPSHVNSLSSIISRFHKKLSNIRSYLKSPVPHGSENRVWCVFCNCDIEELPSFFAFGTAIHHLASASHLKNTKNFLWKHGGKMDKVDSLRILEADVVKWEKKCRLLKSDGANETTHGSLNDIHNEFNSKCIDTFNQNINQSINSSYMNVVECVKQDFGSIDILVHSLANGPEVSKPLLETSRNGYLTAISASSYAFVSLLRHFLPIINSGGSTISLTYIASERIIPGYGGGISSAKAALESDTKVLAFEAGRKSKIRVNTMSAGPLRSRAAKAIGFIEMMIDYSVKNAPFAKELSADEVGNAAAFLASPLASAITGSVLYVDNGLNAMGVGVDSPVFTNLDIPTGN
ncbi:enoyl-[acyl-carrier-protein] reductase [NADH], chloroplastic-like [Impatiens glandulifera]|uniref:enoyl-[acyl-carrier-protein] reductase [NADH], chloroplastic-like n=1 Tax=Impatiens glandulifera TaxID=253017 RepID=UPI001FB168C6|nr:enoyl-[acyl-carrier-protein] reductase [NADH], chloroplastic-like [Impatiens glandulifera]